MCVLSPSKKSLGACGDKADLDISAGQHYILEGIDAPLNVGGDGESPGKELLALRVDFWLGAPGRTNTSIGGLEVR